jgi:hypothetical protein
MNPFRPAVTVKCADCAPATAINANVMTPVWIARAGVDLSVRG